MSKNLNEEILKLFACYGRQCDEITMIAWHEVLESYPINVVTEAMDQFKRSGDQFPTTGKICEIIEGTGDEQFSFETSWQKVLGQARGKQHFLLWSETSALGMMGGLRMIENAKDDQLLSLKKEFIRCLKLFKNEMRKTPEKKDDILVNGYPKSLLNGLDHD